MGEEGQRKKEGNRESRKEQRCVACRGGNMTLSSNISHPPSEMQSFKPFSPALLSEPVSWSHPGA